MVARRCVQPGVQRAVQYYSIRQLLVNQDNSRYNFNADEGEGSGSRNVERPVMHHPSISILNA